MKVLTGRVVDGKVELAGEVAEGTPVAVLAADGEESRLTEEQQTDLTLALRDIQHGDFEDGLELLRSIRTESAR